MRPLAGPAMMLVMVGGFLAYRLASADDSPPRSVTKLEFAGADDDHTGTCYSFDTILFAHRFGSTAVRTWTSPSKNVWVLLADDVVQSNGGPVRDFQKFTFEKIGEQVQLTAVDTSKGHVHEVDENIDELIGTAQVRGATPIDRCLEPGATGYHFKPKR